MKKIIVMMLLLATLSCLISACKKEPTSISISDTAQISFTGYNGTGVAELSNEYDWLNKIEKGKRESDEKYATKINSLKDAVTYSISPNENLKNGDSVTIYTDVNEDVFVWNNYRSSTRTRTFVVSGLKELQEYNAFEHIKVDFSGLSPYGKITIHELEGLIEGLQFVPTREDGLKNGERLTIDVVAADGSDVKEFCKKAGYVLKDTSMSVKVELNSSYLTSLDDIPEEWLLKMKNKTEELVKTEYEERAKAEKNSKGLRQLVKYRFCGSYLFYMKTDEFKQKEQSETVNDIVMLYAITATSNTGEFIYLYAVSYPTAIIDGDQFSVDLENYSLIKNDFLRGSFTDASGTMCEQIYPGLKDMDEAYRYIILPKIEKYKYETNVNGWK